MSRWDNVTLHKAYLMKDRKGYVMITEVTNDNVTGVTKSLIQNANMWKWTVPHYSSGALVDHIDFDHPVDDPIIEKTMRLMSL